jgi:hypothetical protein
MNAKLRAALVATVAGGLVAGAIDIGAACLINGRSVTFILHSIAGGLLAGQAFSGGTRTAIFGAVLQEMMGIVIAAIYVLAALLIPALLRRWLVFGLAYGVIIFLVMNYLVVPLSAWRRYPHFSATSLVANMVAMLIFGLIVSYGASRQSGRLQSAGKRAYSQAT